MGSLCSVANISLKVFFAMQLVKVNYASFVRWFYKVVVACIAEVSLLFILIFLLCFIFINMYDGLVFVHTCHRLYHYILCLFYLHEKYRVIKTDEIIHMLHYMCTGYWGLKKGQPIYLPKLKSKMKIESETQIILCSST